MTQFASVSHSLALSVHRRRMLCQTPWAIAASKACFVVCPLGAANSDVRQHADRLLAHIVAPVLTTHGYSTTRADHLDKPGFIADQLVEPLVSDALVIAGLSNHNPNVLL